MSTFHKPIRKANKSRRTFRHVVYDSLIERQYAETLSLDPDIRHVDRQVPVQLGPDFHTKVDFVVAYHDGRIEYHEVKGFETPRWRDVVRLWRKYRPATLRVIDAKGRTSEVIEGGDDAE